MQNYDTLKTLPITQTEEPKLSLVNASPEGIPHLEQKLMSLQDLTTEKTVQLQKKTHSAITYFNTCTAT